MAEGTISRRLEHGPTLDVPVPELDGDVDPAAFRRVAALLYVLMATGMTEREAARRLRNEWRPWSGEGA